MNLHPLTLNIFIKHHRVKLCSAVTKLLQGSATSIRNCERLCRTCTLLRSISLSKSLSQVTLHCAYFSNEALHQSGTTKDCRTCTFFRSIYLSKSQSQAVFDCYDTSTTKHYINQEPRQSLSYLHLLTLNIFIKSESSCVTLCILLQRSATSSRNHDRLCRTCTLLRSISLSKSQAVFHCYDTSPRKHYINQEPRKTVELAPSYAQYLYQITESNCVILCILLQRSATSTRNHDRLCRTFTLLRSISLSKSQSQTVFHCLRYFSNKALNQSGTTNDCRTCSCTL